MWDSGQSNSEKPTFLLGVGTQKSGTTWLAQQLGKAPQINLGILKEYHIWDALYIDHFSHFLVENPDPDRDWCNTDCRALNHNQLKYVMQNLEGVYETYFRHQLSETVRITGDITPSYSGLNATQFTLIRKRLEKAGFAVKVIFLMREPVARSWSSLRLRQALALKRGEVISDADLMAGFSDFYKLTESMSRTRYDQTVEHLKAAFDKNDLYFGFYENMFEATSLAALQTFLGVEIPGIDIHQKANVSKHIALSADLAASCREFHHDVYTYCYSEFPVTQKLWQQG